MANILQASKWMKEGKKCTRENLRGFGFFHSVFDYIEYVNVASGKTAENGMLKNDDLLADDWEIFNEL